MPRVRDSLAIRPLLMVAALTTVLASTGSAAVVLTRIADTSTVVPGGNGGSFLSYFSGPAISGGTVAFYGAGGGRVGIYTGSGGAVARVADNSMAVPNGTGNFYDFGGPSISGGTVAFQGIGTTTGATGIYTGPAAGGTLNRVIDTSMNAPGAGRFSNFRYTPDIVGDTIAFHGLYAGTNGLTYGSVFTTRNGTITPIVTPAEIDGFGSIGAPQLSSTGAVAFYGYKYSNYGIYTGTGGALTTIADRLTLVPGVNAQFAGFGNPSILGDTVVFSGNSSGIGSTVYGIFSGSGGTLSTLVDSTMSIPGGSGNFAAFGEDLAISSQALAFTAIDSAQRNALYLSVGGDISKVVGVGDVLDGKVVSAVAITSNSLDGTTVAFRASFVGGSQGVYIGSAAAVPVPEPSSLALAGVGLTLALAAARRSRGQARSI